MMTTQEFGVRNLSIRSSIYRETETYTCKLMILAHWTSAWHCSPVPRLQSLFCDFFIDIDTDNLCCGYM